MKKIILKSLGCLAALAFMASCNDTMDDKADIDSKYVKSFDIPTFAFAGATDITHKTATLQLTCSDVTNVIEQGVQLDTDPEFSDYINLYEDEAATELSIPLDDLEPETTYYVRPYIVTSNSEVVYGTQVSSFTTAEAPAETWIPRYVGDFTYSAYYKGDDTGLTLYNLEQNPAVWKIENWGGGVDFIFTWNEDNTISFDPFFLGDTYGEYGDVICYDRASIYDDEDPGYVDTEKAIFYFNIGYRVSAGWVAYGFEQFQITGNASVKDRKPHVAHRNSTKTVKDMIQPFAKF